LHRCNQSSDVQAFEHHQNKDNTERADPNRSILLSLLLVWSIGLFGTAETEQGTNSHRLTPMMLVPLLEPLASFICVAIDVMIL
jgi:hypothetical protein